MIKTISIREALKDDIDEETYSDCYVDDTRDGYILCQFDNENFDYYQENNNALPYIYKIYDPEGEEIHKWESKSNSLELSVQTYLSSDVRKKFIRYVNIDRNEKDSLKDYKYEKQSLFELPSYKASTSVSYPTYSTGNYYGNYYNNITLSEEEAFKKYNNSNTLCLHKSDPTTTMLDQIYNGKGWDVINDCYSISHETLHKLIDSHERIVMLGHGTSGGLIGFIRNCCAEHLKGKKLFMLWCNADGYWAYHKDLGTGWYCTGNMPSDSGEARWVGYHVDQNWMNDNITYWCKLCGDVVEQCLEGDAKTGAKYIRDKYWEKYKDSTEPDQIGITIYNYQRTKTSGEDLIPAPIEDIPQGVSKYKL